MPARSLAMRIVEKFTVPIGLGWMALRATRGVALPVAAGYALLLGTGQGNELAQSLDSLAPASTWLVVGAVLYWILQSWIWARLALLVVDRPAIGLKSDAKEPADLQYRYWTRICVVFPHIYLILILALSALQFNAVEQQGLAYLVTATATALIVFLAYRLKLHFLEGPDETVPFHAMGHKLWNRSVDFVATVLLGLRADGVVLSRRWQSAASVSFIAAIGVFAQALMWPLRVADNFRTLGVVFLFLGRSSLLSRHL